jgi:murein DD-endopeptidase MepM/ murein hydrolase activator NlpD
VAAALVVAAGFVTVAARPPQPADAVAARPPQPADAVVAKPDPDWVFYTNDKTWYTSPWFGGKHRIMIPFGCTRAPYYSPDPRCTTADGWQRGFHHGIDIAMACGTKLFAGRRALVVDPASLGPAYGTTPLLLHSARWDLVIGHVRKRFVAPGDVVRRGDLIALASDNGAPDGCHLHFEKRASGGGLDTATYPKGLLGLTPVVP